MNENQKKTTDQYRDNWDNIFNKGEPIPFLGWVEEEEQNGDDSGKQSQEGSN